MGLRSVPRPDRTPPPWRAVPDTLHRGQAPRTVAPMLNAGPAKKLIVTVNESDRWQGRSVYNELLELFQKKGLAGATVSRAMAGFTGRGAIRTINLVDLASGMPVRIEVVDSAEDIDRVLPDVYDIVDRGLVEVQDTQVVKISSGSKSLAPPTSAHKLEKSTGQAKMLNIHVGADDTWEGEPLHEAIVKRARQLGIAGATVYRGVLGYGPHGPLHRHRVFALSQDEPVMVTVIDAEEKVSRLLAAIDSMVSRSCLIAVSDVTVIRYEHPEAGASDLDASVPKPGTPHD